MATTISGTILLSPNLTIAFPAADRPGSGGLNVTLSAYKDQQVLGTTGTPPTTKVYYQTLTGNQTVDLTAAASEHGETVDGTGLKVQNVVCINTHATATVTIAPGASNGYQLCGTNSLVVQPDNGYVALAFKDNLADIDSTHKTLDITATGSYLLLIVMG